ncbi:zinc finger protein 830-like [Paramacrobiotus metropolitanus]|uniref:zinc finger protein 830-like n=1 Tax=Paramacrobiotus metropolitanus TaxID=2943436 RepID=UPI002445DB39|nr:zinc finger protein 830-like [Paramacrobiotus metropolitanus]
MAQKSGLSKEDLRRLMKEKSAKKLDSPFAKYDNSGQLYCILCKASVKSEASWKAHENGRQHQLAFAATKNPDAAKIRAKPADPVSSASPAASADSSLSERKQRDEPPPKKPKITTLTREMVDSMEVDEAQSAGLPSDFFDAPSIPTPSEAPTPSDPVVEDTSSAVPDDFFDKPTKNIRQKLEREKQKQEEEEWSKFQKAIHEESHKSAMAVEQEDEAARKQRELEEIEEQMTRWQKIHDLEIRREQGKGAAPVPEKKGESVREDSGEEDSDDVDTFDWRKRKLW